MVSANKIVNIIPQLITAQGSDFELAGLFLTKNTTLPYGKVYKFSQESTEAYFGTASPEAAIASVYFKGFTGKQKSPSYVLFSRYADAPTDSWLRGASLSLTMTDFKSITDGYFSFMQNDLKLDVTGLDFTSANTYSDVATIINTALNNLSEDTSYNVTYSSQFKAITIQPSSANNAIGFGVDSELTGTPIVGILKLREDDGAVVSQNAEIAPNMIDNMKIVLNNTLGWVTFAKTWKLDPYSNDIAEDIAFDNWASGQQYGVRFVYVQYDNQEVDKDPNVSVDFASKAKEAGASCTSPNFGDVSHAAFVMGCVASINFNQPDGRITLAFKKQSGLATTISSDDEYTALTDKGYNVYSDFATAANQFRWYQRGSVLGNYGFLDSLVNHIWLNDALQVAVCALLDTRRALPYNNKSYSSIQSAIATPIATALQAGVINIGIDLDQSQLDAIESEIGIDISNELYTQGWYFYTKSPAATIRNTRGSPILKFYYTDGGSIQQIDLTSTAIR